MTDPATDPAADPADRPAAGHPDVDPAVALRGPAAVAACVPHLLGFRPGRSAVLLLLAGAGAALRATVRADLPEEDEYLGEWSADLVDRAGRSGATAAILVVFPLEPGEEPAPRPWRAPALPRAAEVAALRGALADAGIRLVDALCATATTWWSYTCSRPACCPPGGGATDSDPDGVAARAALVVGGMGVLPDRAALGWAVQAAPPAERAAAADVAAAVRAGQERFGPRVGPAAPPRSWARWRAGQVGAVVALLAAAPPGGAGGGAPGAGGDAAAGGPGAGSAGAGPGHLPGAGDTARVLLALADRRIRDAVLWHLQRTPDGWARAVPRLEAATRLAPAGLVAPVATTLALGSWCLGWGARAQVALDRALDDDPGYSLAGLVASALDAGLPPDVWVATMAALSEEECLRGPGARRAPSPRGRTA